MPRVSQYAAFQYEGFKKGYVREIDSSSLDETELFEALNVRLGRRGEITYRNGYALHSSNVSQVVHWLFPWRSASGVDHLIIIDALGNILEDTLDGSFTDSTEDAGIPSGLASYGVGFASATDNLYISAKTMSSDVVSFDGATWSTVAAIPKTKILIARHDRLFAINDATNPSTIYFSSLGDPEVFDALDIIEVSAEDGYEINAAVEFGDDIILFKDHEVWKLSGRTPNTFALYRVDNERGCVSQKSLAQVGGSLIFYDRDTGVWSFDGANFTLISEPINSHILDDQTYDNAYRASAFVSKEGRYHLSMEVN